MHSSQRVCEFGGTLYDRLPYHESKSIDVRDTGILKSGFKATLIYIRPLLLYPDPCKTDSLSLMLGQPCCLSSPTRSVLETVLAPAYPTLKASSLTSAEPPHPPPQSKGQQSQYV